MHKYLIALTLSAALFHPGRDAHAGTGDASTHAPAPAAESKEERVKRENPPLCYQQFCLGDHIRKLALSGAEAGPRETTVNLKAYPTVLNAAKGIYIAPQSSISILALRGFAGNPGIPLQYGATPWVALRAPATLDAVKSIQTICQQPDRRVDVETVAANGKRINLSYRAANLPDGTSHFVLNAMEIGYPGLQTDGEVNELAKQAQAAVAPPMTCEFGSYVTCTSTGMIQDISFRRGNASLWLKMSYASCHAGACEDYGLWPRFNPDVARSHPSCKRDISF